LLPFLKFVIQHFEVIQATFVCDIKSRFKHHLLK